jgi:hypothetical protein
LKHFSAVKRCVPSSTSRQGFPISRFAILLIPLTALLAGCLAPGERDPTRYPWDPRNRPAAAAPHPRIVARGAVSPDPNWQPQPQQPLPPGSSYCIIAIEQESQSGIVAGGNTGVMACTAPAHPAEPR